MPGKVDPFADDPTRRQLHWAVKAKRHEADDAKALLWIAEQDTAIAANLAKAARLNAALSPGPTIEDTIADLARVENEYEVMRSVWNAADELAAMDGNGQASLRDVHAALQFCEAHGIPIEDGPAGTFAGIASAYGVVADNGSGRPPCVIVKGAFAEAVRDFGRVRLLRDHDPQRVVGTITALRETDEGLWLEGAFARTPLGEETAELVRSQGLKELSVGFNVRRWTMGTRDGQRVRIVSDAELIEVSVVPWAANPGAVIRIAASRNPGGSSVLAEVEAIEADYAALTGLTPRPAAVAPKTLLDVERVKPPMPEHPRYLSWIRGDLQ